MTKKMARGVLAMVLLVACGDAATSGAEPGTRPSAEGTNAPSTESGATPERQDESGTTPAPVADGGAPGADASNDLAPVKPAPADCTKRTGGALLTFQKGNETWTVWSTNAKLNVAAFTASAQGKVVTVAFGDLVDGVDCDGQWTWHVDADDIALDADYEASCDALPSTVEANKAQWLVADRWCPGQVLVSSYQGYP